jgi:hypothetical protein
MIEYRRPGGRVKDRNPLDAEIKLPPKRLRIDPGAYQAKSVDLRWREGFGRKSLELSFEIYQGDVMTGEFIPLGRVPYFLRMPGEHGLSPNSLLARLYYLLGYTPTRYERVRLNILLDKLWSVTIGDNNEDSRGEKLSKEETYSVIKRVVGRLA